MIHRNTLVFSSLTRMARQRLGLDESPCSALLELIESCAELDAALHTQLGKDGLSDVKFSILLTLFTLEPHPVCPADLAGYAGFTRSSVTDAVQDLQTRGYVVTERATSDRRSVEVRLTSRGRETVEGAVTRYLQNLHAVLQALANESPAVLRRLGHTFAHSAQLLTA